jgi:hypothetical protein
LFAKHQADLALRACARHFDRDRGARFSVGADDRHARTARASEQCEQDD